MRTMKKIGLFRMSALLNKRLRRNELRFYRLLNQKVAGC